ncbi:Txe/YoeB family addiction module toxin [Nitratifractor sp.]
MKLIWSESSWEDYLYWQKQDRRILKKINKLLKEISRHPFEGLGKPEPLKHTLQGCWSRRIDDEHRLVYKITKDAILIVSCRYHY